MAYPSASLKIRSNSAAVVGLSLLLLTIVILAIAARPRPVDPGDPLPLAASAYRKIPTVVFIGDSYTAGAGAPNVESNFVSRLAEFETWSVVNLGRGGTGYATTSTIENGCGTGNFCGPYRTMLAMVLNAEPDIVVVSGGRNDISKSLGSVRGQVQALYAKIRGELPHAVIIATSPIWDSSQSPENLRRLGAEVRGSVQAVDGYYLDIGEPLAGHPEFMDPDDVHPNARGHTAISISIERALSREGVPYATRVEQ